MSCYFCSLPDFESLYKVGSNINEAFFKTLKYQQTTRALLFPGSGQFDTGAHGLGSTLLQRNAL